MIETVDGVPLLGVRGESGSGKTTLLRALVDWLVARGRRVGALKHTHHDVEDAPAGKDSRVLRDAGAREVMLVTPRRWLLSGEVPRAAHVGEAELTALARRFELDELDLLLIEGYRGVALPRIAIHRVERDGAFGGEVDIDTIALASNARPLPSCTVPVFDLDSPATLATWLDGRLQSGAGLRPSTSRA
ncbi:MAG: molybdopterin-guanine dinucleotide biosynthesis protein B [Gammaproteobacteria bacterium]